MEAGPSEQPVEQEPLSLRCTADNYTYEHLRWYRLDPRLLLQEQRGRGPQEDRECRSVHLYAGELEGRLSFRGAHNSWELEVHMAAVGLADEGNYVCEAQSRRSGEKQCLLKYISVKREQRGGWRSG